MVTSLLNLQDLSVGMLASIKTHCVACALLFNTAEKTNFTHSPRLKHNIKQNPKRNGTLRNYIGVACNYCYDIFQKHTKRICNYNPLRHKYSKAALIVQYVIDFVHDFPACPHGHFATGVYFSMGIF